MSAPRPSWLPRVLDGCREPCRVIGFYRGEIHYSHADDCPNNPKK